MIPERKSSAARPALVPKRRLGSWIALFPLLFGTAFHGHAEIGLDYSPLFTINTTYVANVGVSNSSLFTLDTRYGLGVHSNQSGLFILDTRLSANMGIGASLDFILDTHDAVVATAAVNGNISATSGGALPGVFVQALQTGIMRGSTFTDNSGHYQLSLAAGTYELRASKIGWLTGIRGSLTISANQIATQNFSLDSPPPPPVVEPTTRQPPLSSPRPIPPRSNLKVFVDGLFRNGSLDTNKMTVVMTHGWKSNPEVWATNMAQQMVNAGVSANIIAWDWRDGANPGANIEPLSVSWGTALQGEALGVTLYDILGSDYSHPIHFIGHSLGTLVNAAAANYLHGDAPKDNASPPWLSTRTHVTLLDEAAPVEDIMNYFEAINKFAGPIPRRKGWADNYYSIYGRHHPDAVNIFLGRVAYQYPLDAILFYAHWHQYPHQWYSSTIANPNTSLMGYRYSFEHMNELSNFPTPWPFPYGYALIQDPSLFASEFNLILPLNMEEGIKAASRNLRAFGVRTYQGTVKIVNGSVQAIGNVSAGISEKFLNANNTFSLQISLQTSPLPIIASKGETPPSGADEVTNSPPYAWLNISVPTNAAFLEFDFTLTGDGHNDYFVAGVNGTNIFAFETRFIPQDTSLGSGAIDFSKYAGQTVDMFFGIAGGTSTNASLTVDGIRFYSIQPPSLSVFATNGEAIISWPVAGSGYLLESATTLHNASNWSLVTNIPTIIDFDNVVTNAMDQPNRFYRLRKQ